MSFKKREIDMTTKQKEATIAILTALLVLFVALLAPLVSAVVSILALAAIGFYKLLSKEE